MHAAIPDDDNLRDAASAGAAPTLVVASMRLALLPERAVWIESLRLVLVADLHLGKAASFRRLGVPVPRGTTSDNLDRLTSLVAAFEAHHVVFLGDFLHAPEARAPSTLAALEQWRARHADLELTLVRGNHDRRAGDPPAWLRASCVDEPHRVPGTTLLLAHHPRRNDSGFVLAGHEHPCAVVTSGFERARLPCFHARSWGMTLPAFGAFTGMHPIDRGEQDRVFAIAGDRVVELAPRGAG